MLLLATTAVFAQSSAPAALAPGYAYPERDIRLRAEPARGARTVSSVPQDYPVRVGRCEEGWCEVEYVGVRGYVQSELLRFAEVPAPRRLPTAPRPSEEAIPVSTGVVEVSLDVPQSIQPDDVRDPNARVATVDPEADTERWVGYLLADKVYRKPDAFAEEVTSVTSSDQVRIVRLAGMDGWYEVYLVGSPELMGYAYTPYVSPGGGAGRTRSEPLR